MSKKMENKKIIIIVIGIIIIALIIIKVIDNNYQTEEKTVITNSIIEETKENLTEEKMIVYITGEVQNEGIIELEYGDRIADAIEKAGGVTENANLKDVNLAYELEDGQKLYIPSIHEENSEIIDDGTGGIEGVEESEEIININKADSEELQNLNGIGESLAQSIIKYREENGRFKVAEDLLNVPGIGESKLAKIKENIKLK